MPAGRHWELERLELREVRAARCYKNLWGPTLQSRMIPKSPGNRPGRRKQKDKLCGIRLSWRPRSSGTALTRAARGAPRPAPRAPRPAKEVPGRARGRGQLGARAAEPAPGCAEGAAAGSPRRDGLAGSARCSPSGPPAHGPARRGGTVPACRDRKAPGGQNRRTCAAALSPGVGVTVENPSSCPKALPAAGCQPGAGGTERALPGPGAAPGVRPPSGGPGRGAEQGGEGSGRRSSPRPPRCGGRSRDRWLPGPASPSGAPV